MTDRIEDRLKKMIVERLFLKIAPDAIEEDKSLIDHYGVDSVSLLELVVGLEEEFGIVVGDEDFSVKHFETVAALAEFVRGKLDAAT
jgi:acyl carrier protein